MWQSESDFGSVRDSNALGRLPEAERRDWQRLWADVADTRAQAQRQSAPDKKAPVK
jgi:hypothetical protein